MRKNAAPGKQKAVTNNNDNKKSKSEKEQNKIKLESMIGSHSL
jgi:hypothetical protein